MKDEQIKLTLHDVDFMTGLPMYGVVGDILLVRPRDRPLEDFIYRYCIDGSA